MNFASWLFLLAAFNLAHAQVNDAYPVYRQLTERDGLSDNKVHAIFQDSRDFIWIGTEKGLNLFNGISFEIFEYLSFDSLRSANQVNVIFEDRSSSLWIGTDEGLFLYDRRRHSFAPVFIHHKHTALSREPVLDMVETRSGFAIALPDRLVYLSADAFTTVNGAVTATAHSVLKIPGIATIDSDTSGVIWLGSEELGLVMANPSGNGFTTPRDAALRKALSQADITRVFIDKENTAWIAARGKGLYRYSAAGEVFYETSIAGAVLDITDTDDKIWFGTENGLYFYHKRQDSFGVHPVFRDNRPGISNAVYDVFIDNHQNLWVGLDNGAVNLYENNNLRFFGKRLIPTDNADCAQCNDVLSFVTLPDGRLMVGTDGSGLFFYDENIDLIQRLPAEDGAPDEVILALYRDSEDNIWVGTYSHGVHLFDPRNHTFENLGHLAKKTTDGSYYDVRDFLEDREGYIWIATNGGGLFRYDKETGDVKNYRKGDGYAHNLLSDYTLWIYEDRSGYLWIGTYEGVSRYDREADAFTSYSCNIKDASTISNNWVFSIAEDREGNVWIGTAEGLNKFSGNGKFKRYYAEQGLPGNKINGMVPDNNGFIWISTENGLSKFDPKEEHFVNFEEREGLQHKNFIHGSSFKDEAGRIYFGGFSGFNVFHPDSIRINPYVPKIAFSKFRVNNIEVDPKAKDSPLEAHINETERIVLSHDQSSFSIEFAALNYVRSEKNRFAYMLEGFDKTWNHIETARPANYTNLDPGKYKFRVIGSNDFGVWNSKGKELSITILPPWWATWWAWVIYLIMLALSVYFVRRYTIISVNLKKQLWLEHMQKEKSEELNQLKLQFFTNISHELRTPLSLIVGPLERLSNKEVKYEEVDIIKRNVFRLRNLVDQLLDFRKIESDKMELNLSRREVVGFVKSVTLNFKDFARQKNINLTFQSTHEKLEMQIDEDKIEKMITNLLSNALKYTGQNGAVTVNVSTERNIQDSLDYLALKISDTGKGIAKEDIENIFERFYTSQGYKDSEIGAGIGLHLTHRLVELHEGRISVESQLGKGSTFTIMLPLTEPLAPQRQNTAIEKQIHCAVETRSIHENGKIPESNAGKRTILIIDDNIELCNYLEKALKDEFNVVKEPYSLKGVDQALTHMPDLIISDVMMPDLNGIDLCKKLKTDLRLCHIPVVLLTAKASTEDHIKGYETGADDYIYKPFNEGLLITRVKNLIRQRDQLREHFIGSDGLMNSKATAHSLDRSFVDEVLQIIKDNYKDPDFCVNTIIENVGMSRSVFYKKFKALSNQPITELIKNFRLKRAEELLAMNRYTISEVAYDTGFSDPAYFSKVFKEKYKLSPKDFTAGAGGAKQLNMNGDAMTEN